MQNLVCGYVVHQLSAWSMCDVSAIASSMGHFSISLTKVWEGGFDGEKITMICYPRVLC
jgi:hypothetical protein